MASNKKYRLYLDDYTNHMKKNGVPEPTMYMKKCLVSWMCNMLEENKIYIPPYAWEWDVAYFILDKLSNSTGLVQTEYYRELLEFAAYFENGQLRGNMNSKYNRNRLNIANLDEIMAKAEGIERIMFHLIAYLKMSYTDVANLCISNIKNDCFVIRTNRDKCVEKTVFFDSETKHELKSCLLIRELRIGWARGANENIEVPEQLLIHREKGVLRSYSIAAIYYRMKTLSEKVGIEFNIQTLKSVNLSDVENKSESICQKSLDAYSTEIDSSYARTDMRGTTPGIAGTQK